MMVGKKRIDSFEEDRSIRHRKNALLEKPPKGFGLTTLLPNLNSNSLIKDERLVTFVSFLLDKDEKPDSFEEERSTRHRKNELLEKPPEDLDFSDEQPFYLT